MSNTITLWEKCEHGKLDLYQDGHFTDAYPVDWCPGGRKRTFERPVYLVELLLVTTDPPEYAGMDVIADHNLWVEVTDEAHHHQ